MAQKNNLTGLIGGFAIGLLIGKLLSKPAAVGNNLYGCPNINSIGAIKKIKWLTPYDDKGRANFLFTTGKAGVYFIQENNKITYVGYSGYNLYKTMYRHFQQWNHRTQIVVSYKNKTRNNYKVRVILCTPNQAQRLELYFINKLKPRDNSNMIDFNYVPDAATVKDIQSFQNAEYESAPF